MSGTWRLKQLLKLEARQDSDPCLNPWFRVRLCGRLLKGQADTTFLGNVVIAPIRVHGGRLKLGELFRWLLPPAGAIDEIFSFCRADVLSKLPLTAGDT